MAALYGDDDVKTLTAQIFLANAEGFAGHFEAGCNDYVAAAQRLREVLKRRIPLMSQTEREAFWSPLSSLLTNMTPYALESIKARRLSQRRVTMPWCSRRLSCSIPNARSMTS